MAQLIIERSNLSARSTCYMKYSGAPDRVVRSQFKATNCPGLSDCWLKDDDRQRGPCRMINVC